MGIFPGLRNYVVCLMTSMPCLIIAEVSACQKKSGNKAMMAGWSTIGDCKLAW